MRYIKIAIFVHLMLFQISSSGQNCLNGTIEITQPLTCCHEVDYPITFELNITLMTCVVDHWVWYFGNGQTDTTSVPYVTYTYPSAGSFVVTVRAFNSSGVQLNAAVGSFTVGVRIFTGEQCDECAIVDFDFNNVLCGGPTVTNFTNQTIVPNCDYSGILFSWNFGDPASGVDNTSTLESPSHYFSSAGSFLVKLTVTLPVSSSRPIECTESFSLLINDTIGTPIFVPVPNLIITNTPTDVNTPVQIQFQGYVPFYDTSNCHVSFGDNTPIEDWDLHTTLSHHYTSVGTFTVIIYLFPNSEYFPSSGNLECQFRVDFTIIVLAVSLDCKDCIGSFNPEPGKRYLIDAWVREDGAGPLVVNFLKPNLSLSFYDFNGVITTLASMQAKGEIIDGWQRIEEEFVVPYNAVGITIQMKCSSGNCLFDDVRVFPYDGMMKGYVYDPVTLKLVAELDERNYATFYEYDEEGKLIRVKKETERGIMTIKENRNHSSNK